MSIYTHYTIEATTRLGEVYVWNPLISEYEYQGNQESSNISSEYEAIDEFDYAVAVADNYEYIEVRLLRVTEISIKKRLYEELWELKDMRYRLQLLREFCRRPILHRQRNRIPRQSSQQRRASNGQQATQERIRTTN